LSFDLNNVYKKCWGNCFDLLVHNDLEWIGVVVGGVLVVIVCYCCEFWIVTGLGAQSDVFFILILLYVNPFWENFGK